jgi:hypothetical protein
MPIALKCAHQNCSRLRAGHSNYCSIHRPPLIGKKAAAKKAAAKKAAKKAPAKKAA